MFNHIQKKVIFRLQSIAKNCGMSVEVLEDRVVIRPSSALQPATVKPEKVLSESQKTKKSK